MHLENMEIRDQGGGAVLVATLHGTRGEIPLVQDPLLIEKGFLQLGEAWQDQALDVTLPPDPAHGQAKPEVRDAVILDPEAFADYARAHFYSHRGYVGAIPSWGQALRPTDREAKVGGTATAPPTSSAAGANTS
ncbi:MAG TPA: hypothetical protein VFB73_15610 [Chloroflexota bacterium]|nr:hypothetical protein [Chloroflexota bacterium]